MKEITKLEAQYFLKQFKEQLHQGHLGLFFFFLNKSGFRTKYQIY